MNLAIYVRNPIERNDLTLILIAVIASQLDRIDIDPVHDPQRLPAGGNDIHLSLNTKHFYVVSINSIRVGSIIHENHLYRRGPVDALLQYKNGLNRQVYHESHQRYGSKRHTRSCKLLNVDRKTNGETTYLGDRLQQAMAESSLALLRSV